MYREDNLMYYDTYLGGDIGKAMEEYSIDYCAATFDELYNVLKKWSELPDE